MSIAAANMPFTRDFIDSAETAQPFKAIAENAELEELAGLFHDYHKAIFHIAYRMTGSRSDAEDVLQTIFLRLTTNRGEGYLKRTAVNASLDLLRYR